MVRDSVTAGFLVSKSFFASVVGDLVTAYFLVSKKFYAAHLDNQYIKQQLAGCKVSNNNEATQSVKLSIGWHVAGSITTGD